MKLSKKELLENIEKYKDRNIKIGCFELLAKDLLNSRISKIFKNNDMFIVEKKLEDFLSQEEIKCFEELKKIIEKSNKEDKKVIINMLLSKGE